MTPLIFISFLLSLALVDLRNSVARARYHAYHHPAQRSLPGWLHRLVYRYRPYRYSVVQGKGQGQDVGGGEGSSPFQSPSPGLAGKGEDGEDYYHSKQRKLMKMEVAEAFEIRVWVLGVLGLVGLGGVWVIWRVGVWVVGVVVSLLGWSS
jgi:hypothetical protein